MDSNGNASTPLALSSFSLLQANWFENWEGAIPGSNSGIAAIAAPVMDWGHSFWVSFRGNASSNSVSVENPWFPSLDHCTTTPGCIGHYEAIYNALNDLKTRLSDPSISTLAQTNIFDKIGTDSSGNKLTTKSFLAYLNNKPRFYDGTRSTYCYDVLAGVISESFCFKNAFLHFFLNSSVKDHVTPDGQVDAVTGMPSSPLLTFFRPNASGFSSLGQNLGNEGVIFREALHGFTGKYDGTIEEALGINISLPSCTITVLIQNKVLKHSSGLDQTIQSPCPDLFAVIPQFVGPDRMLEPQYPSLFF